MMSRGTALISAFLLLTFMIAYTSVANAREVEFSWKALQGVSQYEIQVDENDKFEKPLQTSKTSTPAYNTQLGIGQYFYRVRAIDGKGIAGKWSKAQGITVNPYAPELVDPKNGFEATYFEVPPTLEFEWKSVEGNPEYEIYIYKTTGQKILEQKTSDTNFKTSKITEGEYLWKVRTIAKKIFYSDYCEPRHLLITRKPLTAPTLVKPTNNGLSPAYRSVDFEWKQDPATRFTDVYFEKISGMDGAKPFKTKIPNMTGSTYTADYEEPGEYKWSVTTKEAKDTPGLSSETGTFEIRNDVIAKGNYELEFSLSPVSDLYSTNSSLQTNGATFFSQQSSAQGVFTGFLAGYYPLQSLGFFATTRSAKLGVESINGFEQETELSMRLRFGSKGFMQEFIYGYRIMDIVEAENTPSQMGTDFTTFGPVLGTRVQATVKRGWKAEVNFFYYKPTSSMEGTSGLTADVYGGSLGVKWNFMYQFWLGYRFSTERINASMVPPKTSPAVNSGWTMYRTEPLFLSIGYEH